jgi:tetratricopeptide (TPR) repeat protein
VALDPELSEAVAARANSEFLRYSQAGDFKAFAQAQADFRRALELDPSNSLAMFHYGRAMLWYDPDLALSLFEQTIQLDPMRLSAVGFAASIVSMQGRHEEGLERVRQLYEQNPERKFHTAIHVANLEYYGGNLGEAAVFLREALPRGDIGRIHLWALQMSLGDLAAARATLVAPEGDALSSALHEAAGLTMDGHYAQAFALLDRRRAEFPVTRALDVPAARLALIAAKPARARAILEPRLPDLVSLSEPINARNVLPALDLAAAWAGTGEDARADALLAQVAAFLDGPAVPRWPMFIFLRARAHALAGEPDLAQQALERAYSAGFRTTWAIDLLSHPFFYVDCIEVDPAFATVRRDPRFKSWLARVKADNAHQLEQLRARDAEKPAA